MRSSIDPADLGGPLHGCPVRRRYAWQLVRYGPGVARGVRELLAADRDADGADGLRSMRLARLLLGAERETGYYPEAFAGAGVSARDLRDTKDLAHFPSLSRLTLQERSRDVFSRRLGPRDVEEGWLGRSSGSTGEPVRFFMDAASIHYFVAFIRFLWRRQALGPLPGPTATGVVLLCTLPRSSIYETRLPLLRGSRFRKLHFGERHSGETLTRLAPAVVTGDPDSLAAMAERIEGGDARVRARLVLSSAFALPEPLRERLERLTGAVVVEYYSMAETGPIAWRCPAAGRFHVLSPACVLESVGDEIVLTNLRNRLFPLIRYRTGDLGEVRPDDGPCACGSRGDHLVALAGRLVSRFVTAAGARVDPSQLQPLLSRLGARQFQLRQESVDRLVVRLHGEQPSPGALEDLRAGAERLLGPVRVDVSVSPDLLFRPGEKPIVYRSLVAPPT